MNFQLYIRIITKYMNPCLGLWALQTPCPYFLYPHILKDTHHQYRDFHQMCVYTILLFLPYDLYSICPCHQSMCSMNFFSLIHWMKWMNGSLVLWKYLKNSHTLYPLFIHFLFWAPPVHYFHASYKTSYVVGSQCGQNELARLWFIHLHQWSAIQKRKKKHKT